MNDGAAPIVAIVDYGMGNLYSVDRACAAVGLRSAITSSPEEVLAADGVILPGVGAMADAMAVLRRTGLADALIECARLDKPLFGICLGLQLLMAEGTEFARHRGLAILEGTVRRFEGLGLDSRPLRVPHIGWNEIWRTTGGELVDPWAQTPLDGIAEGERMYFVHSYCVVPEDVRLAIAKTTYGHLEFCSAVRHGNLFGCQFHPERSGPQGLRMYAAFAGRVFAGESRVRNLHEPKGVR